MIIRHNVMKFQIVSNEGIEKVSSNNKSYQYCLLRTVCVSNYRMCKYYQCWLFEPLCSTLLRRAVHYSDSHSNGKVPITFVGPQHSPIKP